VQVFSYRQLHAATGGFGRAHMVGQGSFGAVYRGVLPDGRKVAVKLMDRPGKQGEEEFEMEVKTIADICAFWILATQRRMRVFPCAGFGAGTAFTASCSVFPLVGNYWIWPGLVMFCGPSGDICGFPECKWGHCALGVSVVVYLLKRSYPLSKNGAVTLCDGKCEVSLLFTNCKIWSPQNFCVWR